MQTGRLPGIFLTTAIVCCTLLPWGPRQPSAARAAPAGDAKWRYYIKVTPPKSPLCVGVDYDVSVSITASAQGQLNGQRIDITSEPQEGILVEGSVADAGVAALRPDHWFTGATAGVGPGDVTFIVTPRKPGSTQLFFEASAPERPDAEGVAWYLHDEIPITVAYCRYKVIAVSNWGAHYPNLTTRLVARSKGEVQVDEAGNLQGTLGANWVLTNFSAKCSHSQSTSQDRVEITGTRNQNGSLDLNFNYHPAGFLVESCAATSTGVMAPPALDFKFPARGSTRSKAHSFQLYEESMKGRTTVTVIPIPGQ